MRTAHTATVALGLTLAGLAASLSACGSDEDSSPSAPPSTGNSASSAAAETPPAPSTFVDGVVKVAGGRGLYVRCSGTGSPTVVLEGGDGDTSDSYAFAEETLAKETRTCVYDRANLGRSDPAPGPRGLTDLVGDLEQLLAEAEVPGPYVLVGTSGGGYITSGFAVQHPEETAGLVFIDTWRPFRNPPAPIVEETTWNHPANVEQRDYLQVEKDAWAARRNLGDIPVTVVSVKYSAAAIAESPFPSERDGMRRNVSDQRGWLVLSTQAHQIVVNGGHAVEEDDPALVVDVILDVVRAAR